MKSSDKEKLLNALEGVTPLCRCGEYMEIETEQSFYDNFDKNKKTDKFLLNSETKMIKYKCKCGAIVYHFEDYDNGRKLQITEEADGIVHAKHNNAYK